MSDEVLQAFATLRRHLPESLRGHEAALEVAWFNGGPVPVDWPARFRTAGDVAEREEWDDVAIVFRKVAHEMQQWMSADEVEAIGRALLGKGA